MNPFDFDLFMGTQRGMWDAHPYELGGDGYGGSGVDCSHLVWRLYQEQGLDYTYRSVSSFLETLSEYFDEIMEPVPGCVVVYGTTHMGIWLDEEDTFSAQSGSGMVQTGKHSWFAGSRRYFAWRTGGPPPL